MASTGTFLEREVIESAAFRALTATAIRVFLAFRLKIRKRKVARRWVDTNHDELEFPYKEAVARWEIKPWTFRDARDRLIDVGFLDIVETGGGLFKCKTIYALSDRWRKYGTAAFRKVTREKDSRHIGFQNNKPATKSTTSG